ncbi:MAG: cytochrome c, partial [Pseudomonadota bacterium]|nr:cytochrome c [Pseudomonadota bacterium]
NPATDAKTEALPAIWDNWADFSAKSDDLTVAAKALDFKDRAALASTLGGVGLACKACHKDYREKK